MYDNKRSLVATGSDFVCVVDESHACIVEAADPHMDE